LRYNPIDGVVRIIPEGEGLLRRLQKSHIGYRQAKELREVREELALLLGGRFADRRLKLVEREMHREWGKVRGHSARVVPEVNVIGLEQAAKGTGSVT